MQTSILLNMLKDIERHKRDKNKLIEYYIQKRLNTSTQNYYKDLLKAYQLISHKDSTKIIKIINKRK